MRKEINKILSEISAENKYSDETEAIRDIGYVLKYLNDGIYVANVDGTTVMVNDAFERISGISREELIKRNVRELEEEGYWSKSAANEAIRTGEKATITQTYPNGKTGLVTSTPIKDENGSVVKIVSNIRDITELTNLHHELRQKELEIGRYQDMLMDTHGADAGILTCKSKSMEQVLSYVRKAAAVDSNLLLMGETGSGKSTFAKVIGKMSSRKDEPFIEINCGAIPSSLFESELFGYEKGAFTGASKEGKIGLAEMADKGILFLDEISELSMEDQAKLLLFIDSKQIMKIGGKKKKKVDVRIIAAGNRDLKEMVRKGEFREDLYYRLNVITVRIPPLRERREDIVSLIINKVDCFNKDNETEKRVSQVAIDMLVNYSWPGNIRELSNVIEQACVLSVDDEVGPEDFPFEIRRNNDLPDPRQQQMDNAEANKELPVDIKDKLLRIEKKYIEMALNEGGTVRSAANLLNMDPTALQRRKKKYGL